MIRLTNELAIGADKYQFILKERRVKEKGDHKGEVYWKDLGYYPKLSQLITALAEREMYSSVNELNDLHSVQQSLEEWAEGLKTPLLCNLKEAVMKMEPAPALQHKATAQERY